MEYRKAQKLDIDMLLKNRMEFVTSIRKIDDINEFERATREYLNKNLENDKMIYYICDDNGRIVSSCILCICQTIPTPSALSGMTGELLNVYTIEEYRRKGIAKKLITMLIDKARQMGVNKILLDYTDEGYPLYKSLGFRELDRQMELRI